MNYQAVPAVRSEEPLLLGMIGPPGGGKTLSALRLAKGLQSVRGGDIIVIDTEGGRSRKYNDLIPFNIVELPPTARSNDFLDAINAQLPSKPAAIVVDSMSDEHSAYLEWHDEMVPQMGGNEWAAWAKPAAARKKLIAGILKIKVPLIFTFRARDKTKQEGRKVVNIGWQPVAPLEIVHTLDLTCILPPRADGVPVWKSEKIGEDFIIKLPNYLAPHIEAGKALNEDMGAAFARWAKGSVAVDDLTSAAEYIADWNLKIQNATDELDADAMVEEWNGEAEQRKTMQWPAGSFIALQKKVKAAIAQLKKPAEQDAK